MIKVIKLKIWLLRYAIEFRRQTGWSFLDSWKYGKSTMENFNNDLEDLDCPIEMVREDLTCWESD